MQVCSLLISAGSLLAETRPDGLQAWRPAAIAPLVLDLGPDGFSLTSVAGGVDFDLDSDGTPERIAWTSAGNDDAFLAVDRINSGRTENGSKLFGGMYANKRGFAALEMLERDPTLLSALPVQHEANGVNSTGRSGVSQADSMGRRRSQRQVGSRRDAVGRIGWHRRDLRRRMDAEYFGPAR